MRRFLLPLLLLAAALLIVKAALAQSSPPAPTTLALPATPDILYEDPTATSSATITQILPNSQTSLTTLGNVRRIRVQQEILIIEWGTTATSLYPRQYVGSITVNKRAEPAH